MILNGKIIAQEIQANIKEVVAKCAARPPCLAVVLVGDNQASHTYVNQKVKSCLAADMRSIRKDLSTHISQADLLELINDLNNDDTVDGILVQLPLPEHIDPLLIIQAIDPDKDVDGFHPINMGKLLIGDPSGFVPCTPLGIQLLLLHTSVEISGKHVVIIGRSNIVGKPLAALLMQARPGANATVTVAHSKTAHLDELAASADILVVAMGKPQFIKPHMVKQGAVVIDVGMNRIDGKLVGDVDFDSVSEKCSFITPVPGGVGPMTITCLLQNTLTSYQRRCGNY